MQTFGKSKAGHPGHVTVSYSDSIDLIRDEIHWTPKGVRLLTKWHFAEGAEVEFAFDYKGERHCCSGFVVGCRALREPAGFYETFLFFLETPCTSLQKAACDCRLAPPEQDAKDETHFTLSSFTPAGNPGQLSRKRL